MNSDNQLTPFRGSQQGHALHLFPPPLEDPYANWKVRYDEASGLLQPRRKIPLKRKSFSGSVPFTALGRCIWYESLLEQRFLLAIKHVLPLPEILEQPLTLKMRALGFPGVSYTPDFLIWGPEIRPWLVEVKYEEDLRKNWVRLKPRLRAARRYARWRGWDFWLVTDRHLHPDGVQKIQPPEYGLASPYSRVPAEATEPKPRPLIWGAMPGQIAGQEGMDRSALLIPTTAKLLTKLLRPITTSGR